MRLPEIRHNLRLITEACKNDLDGLAREARALEERKKWVRKEDARLRKRVEEEAECKLLLPSDRHSLNTRPFRLKSDIAPSASASRCGRHQFTSEGDGIHV